MHAAADINGLNLWYAGPVARALEGEIVLDDMSAEVAISSNR